MKRVYISHPYTGNEEENLRDAERIRARLKEANPDICYINPLGMLGGPETNYCTALADALELLSVCHAAIFCPGWGLSTGCKAEWAYCKQRGIEIQYWEED